MLIEKASNAQTQVQLVPYFGMVNPEHMNQINCIPIIMIEDSNDNENINKSYLENLFVGDFLKKAKEFRQVEQINSLPIEIRFGTVYTYQNRRQQNRYPNSLCYRNVSVDFLHNEERRPYDDKNFLITFNKNKCINDIHMFEHELICTGFRQINNQQSTYRLYLRYETKRLILELIRETNDPRYLSVERLLKYLTKFTHIDVVKSKHNSNNPKTFDDIFDIRTSIRKASDEEELHINDDYCNFLHINDLKNCVFETISFNGQYVYHFNRNLLPYFDFFQIKKTQTYIYSCMDSQFFGAKILIEQQTGYDLNLNGQTTTTPCLKTNNVIMARLLSNSVTEEEAKRIWMVGIWLSELATKCTKHCLPTNKILCRQPGHVATHWRLVK